MQLCVYIQLYTDIQLYMHAVSYTYNFIPMMFCDAGLEESSVSGILNITWTTVSGDVKNQDIDPYLPGLYVMMSKYIVSWDIVYVNRMYI